MKKLLLSTVAVSALAVAAPAFADESGVKLEVGGGTSMYGVWLDSDDDTVRDFDVIRDTEVHFSGETTLDNGLTVGAHIEADADKGGSTNGDFTVDESYLYMQGSWGRVNLGAEDGAAFLLQVAAPSADANFDGVRQEVNPFERGELAADYDHDLSEKADKITYLSPVFSGFQAGVSYTTDLDASRNSGVTSDNDNEVGDIFDVAVRYEGQFDNVGLTAGVGYTDASSENTGNDQEVWNAGLDLDIGAWGVGVAYLEDDSRTANADVTTMVVGADYTTGPFTIGASYLNEDDETAAGTTLDNETDRYAAGVVYSYGPGMTFRGSVSYIDYDSNTNANDTDETAVMLGTMVNF